jgi:hypothetical protein
MSLWRVLLVQAFALGLSLSTAPTAFADPPASSSPATAGGKKKPASRPAPNHSKPAKPASASKEAPAPSRAPEAAPSATKAHEVVEHESRIEFDERMVHGQSAAGAIFLFQRTPSELKSIVEVPDSFRPKTVELLQSRGTP